MAPIEEETRAERPAAHADLGGNLPPLRPVVGARTPLENCRLPTAVADKDSVDILERLRQLQLSEKAASSGPARHWGENEATARQSLELFCHSDGEERKDALASALSAIEEACPLAVDDDSFHLLHYASMYGSVEAVASLMRKKANINARTKVHETPLQLAAYYRHAEACALLLTHKARIDLADWQGRTPLEAAKESRCGNGPDNHGQAQGRCVELLSQQLEKVRSEWSGSSVGKDAEELRQQGNAFFKKSQYNEAIAAYSLALASFDDGMLYSNRAECYLKVQRNLEAKLDAQKAAGLAKAVPKDRQKGWEKKAFWRLGRACLALSDDTQAAEAAKNGLAEWSDDPALKQLANDAESARRKRVGSGGY
eukprot:TRINITY_DN63714_c0_g1_i1.p1 TRINITY_DN63714_c0_g1~~TRINITY_DN63714_c0_g1_i1.p1  ORF type:complete len:369 (-),score=97.19 TRINITY_DN63714_c0_g1_i1:87-1193(-)